MDAAGSGANHCPQGVGIIAVAATVANTGWWTSTTSVNVTSSNTDVMNQLCRVCGEPAAGFHFGAFTCEGCKSFFGRTYNNLGSISECKNGGVCVINKKNRTACKACRLRKCLMVGMSKSGSRYGRRSNWFKIHCLLQEQSHQAQTRLKDPKTYYEKAYSSLDIANNNSNDNNHENNGPSVGNVSTANESQDRLLVKRSEASRSQEIPQVSRAQEVMRPDLFRPETTRFPMWRAPQFFHPALTHMQLLNANPFFPFQQRYVVPYVNQSNAPQATVFSSSSDSVSSRSTPSPKQKEQQQRTEPAAGEENEERVKVNEEHPRSLGEDSVYDKSVAFLRSLGPEQDEPIDLSTQQTIRDCVEEESSSLHNDYSESEAQTKPPLDLTRKT